MRKLALAAAAFAVGLLGMMISTSTPASAAKFDDDLRKFVFCDVFTGGPGATKPKGCQPAVKPPAVAPAPKAAPPAKKKVAKKKAMKPKAKPAPKAAPKAAPAQPATPPAAKPAEPKKGQLFEFEPMKTPAGTYHIVVATTFPPPVSGVGIRQ